MKFSLEKNMLMKFLNKIKMEGKISDKKVNLNNSFRINVLEKSLETTVIEPNGMILLNVNIDNVDVVETGEMLIDDINEFESLIKLFKNDDNITISSDDKLIYIKGHSKALELRKVSELDIPEIDLSKILKKPEESESGFYNIKERNLTTKSSMESNELNSIALDMDFLGIKIIPVSISKNMIEISVTSDYDSGNVSIKNSLETSSTFKTDEEKVNSTFIFGMHNVLSNLEGFVDIYMGEESAMYIYSEEIYSVHDIKSKIIIMNQREEE